MLLSKNTEWKLEMAGYGPLFYFFIQPNLKNCLFDYIHALYSSLITEEMISICT